MENYICINGKKTELTEEQLKQLGIELPKANPFERAKYSEIYYYISGDGSVTQDRDYEFYSDEDRFNVANYCTDASILDQRALHETLNRLLWRYAMEHGGNGAHVISAHNETLDWYINVRVHKHFEPGFITREIAEAAIKEIIEPFMEAHPEFKW